MLEHVDSLPGAEADCPSRTGIETLVDVEGGANMSRHVVASFGGVAEPGRVFGDQTFEEVAEVAAHVGIGVFLNDQRRGGVLDEDR